MRGVGVLVFKTTLYYSELRYEHEPWATAKSCLPIPTSAAADFASTKTS